MPYVQVDGLVLRYRVSGSGPPLLLVRGLARSLDYWGEFERMAAGSFRVITYDNRGVGGSDTPRPPYTTSAMADDAAGLLRQLGEPRAHVFGVSLGGMIAQMLAIRHPGLVDRLAIACSTPGRSRGRRLPATVLARMLCAPLLPASLAHRVGASLVLSHGHRVAHPESLRRLRDLGRRWPVPSRGFLGQIAAAILHDPREQLATIRAPCLLLHGSGDRLVPLENSHRLRTAIPGSRLEVLPGVGHDLTTEQPRFTLRLLKQFLLGQ